MTSSVRDRAARLLLGAGLLLGAAASGVPVSAGTEAGAIVNDSAISVLSGYDQDQLGFHIRPIPAGTRPAAVSGNAALATASAALGRSAESGQVMHVLAAPDASSPEKTVYVVIVQGGGQMPGGPEGNGLHDVAYWGVVIDDQSGAVLRMFATGSI